MQLDQISSYVPYVAVALGGALLLWGQRDRVTSYLTGYLVADPEDDIEPDMDNELEELDVDGAYACVRYLLDQVEDCPKAADALKLIVLPALVSGTDSPHYQVTWEVKP